MDFGFTNGDCVIIPIPSNMKPQTPIDILDYLLENPNGWKTDVEALEYLKTKKSARKLISRQAWTYMYQGAGVMYIVHPLFEVPLVLGPHDSEESILRKVTIRLDTLKRAADKYSGNV
ncbi:hypothetical protein BJ322DRAFT_1111773 [Thelephora terrestris]|uniref:Uncharacterized protein n=1 Tax=Thelephora terrestris TaxID=56493 RepID=A0A9P6L4G7_9AGAM|nr:hypothetical protein BJ322DRAFT_1111773 [Thelephora terrestris]